MTLFEKCCFCISLRTGGIVIGLLTLVFNAFQLLVFAIAIRDGTTTNMNSSKDPSTGDELIWPVIFVFNVLSLISSSMLIYGALKHRKQFLIPHLVLDVIFCGAIAVLIILWNIISVLTSTVSERKGQLQSIYAFVLLLVFKIYLWLCVLSLHQKITEEQKRPTFIQQYGQQPAYNPCVTYAPVSLKQIQER